ncbi:MAG: hypothetical protein WCK46_01565 [Candidatus Adlerbacteria bacterium]
MKPGFDLEHAQLPAHADEKLEEKTQEKPVAATAPTSTLESGEAVESQPELRVIKDLFFEGAISVQEKDDSEFEGPRKKYTFDTEKLKSIIEKNKPVFDKLKAQKDARIERTPLPPSEKMEASAQHIFDEVMSDMKELNLYPPDFFEKEKSLSPLKLSYDADKGYGRYLDYKYFHNPEDPEAPSAIIDIGGKHIQNGATKIRDELSKIGISMSIDESIYIVTKHLVAHEYGHRVSDAYAEDITKISLDEERIPMPHPFYEKIAKLDRDNELRLPEKREAEGILDEQVSQSFAYHVLSKTLAAKGHSYAAIQAIHAVVGADKKSVQEYKNFVAFTQQQGLEIAGVQKALADAQEKLPYPDNLETTDILRLEFRDVGYYLEPFDIEQLRFVVNK